MSEREPIGPERHESNEARHERESEQPPKHEQHEQAPTAESLAAIQQSLEQEAKRRAVSGKEVPVGEKDKPAHPHYVGKELKQETLRRTLRRVQKQLPAPERLFSKVVHSPAVQAVSEVGAKTIARPSGLLGGGLLALTGSCLVLYVAKHYGFRYNLTLFLVLFAGGFAIGLLLELLVGLVRSRRV